MFKHLAKNISQFGASLYGIDHLIKKSRHHIILPFYHAVTDDNPVHIKNLYKPRSIEDFKNDLEFLLNNYQSISLEELIKLQSSGENVKENYFHLSFDDGLSEFYHIVAPLLKQKNVHATVFLNSDFIDNKMLFFRFKASILFEKLKDDMILELSYKDESKLDELALKNNIDFDQYLKEKMPYLTKEQINELIDDGFTFGAHSKNHPLYKELDLTKQISQTEDSINIISKEFHLLYKVFSFPFTDDGVGLSFFASIEGLTDLTFGCAGLKEDSAKNHLQRIPMETEQSGEKIIKQEYLYYLMKSKVGKNKIIRQ